MKKIFIGVLIVSTLWISNVTSYYVNSFDLIQSNTDVVTTSNWPGVNEE